MTDPLIVEADMTDRSVSKLPGRSSYGAATTRTSRLGRRRGLRCVAVPGPLTLRNDFSAAEVVRLGCLSPSARSTTCWRSWKRHPSERRSLGSGGGPRAG